jgi:hypothetical protein
MVREEFVDAAGRFPVFGLRLKLEFGVNAADHQDPVLGFDFADGLGDQPCIRRIDVAGFQRASEGTGESAGCRRNNVVERCRVRLQDIGRNLVVLGDCAVNAKGHRCRFCR